MVREDRSVGNTQILDAFDKQTAIQSVTQSHTTARMVFADDKLLAGFDALLEILEVPGAWWEDAVTHFIGDILVFGGSLDKAEASGDDGLVGRVASVIWLYDGLLGGICTWY